METWIWVVFVGFLVLILGLIVWEVAKPTPLKVVNCIVCGAALPWGTKRAGRCWACEQKHQALQNQYATQRAASLQAHAVAANQLPTGGSQNLGLKITALVLGILVAVCFLGNLGLTAIHNSNVDGCMRDFGYEATRDQCDALVHDPNYERIKERYQKIRALQDRTHMSFDQAATMVDHGWDQQVK